MTKRDIFDDFRYQDECDPLEKSSTVRALLSKEVRPSHGELLNMSEMETTRCFIVEGQSKILLCVEDKALVMEASGQDLDLVAGQIRAFDWSTCMSGIERISGRRPTSGSEHQSAGCTRSGGAAAV